MPNEIMNEQQVAAYLRMDLRELRKLCSRGQIPCRKVGGKFVFRKGDVDHWVEGQMHKLDKNRLADIAEGVSVHHGIDHEELLVCPLIPEGGIAVPLAAKTRDSAIRTLVDVADGAGMVYARDELVEEINKREELCSTAFLPGVAMPHPRQPLPFDIAASFVVVGLAHSGIPFGAQDGSLTRLFFLICCKDDQTHLHVLARLAQMLHEGGAEADLLDASDAGELADRLRLHEESVVRAR